MADRLDRLTAPGRHTRQPQRPQRPEMASRIARTGRPGLHRVSAVALVMLALQYGLGMILNFYVAIPAADAHAGIITEITTAPLALTAHALLGFILIGTAILLVARTITMRDRLLAVLAAAGLISIGAAFLAGESFVRNGQNGTSFAMAMLTGAALLCYIAILTLTSGARPEPERGTPPLLAPVPAARPRDLADYPDDWGAEPGWDDDPDWAGRLRREADPGWPEPPSWPQGPQPRRPQPQGPQPRRPQPQGPPDWWEHP
jgi:hypothetical protein